MQCIAYRIRNREMCFILIQCTHTHQVTAHTSCTQHTNIYISRERTRQKLTFHLFTKKSNNNRRKLFVSIIKSHRHHCFCFFVFHFNVCYFCCVKTLRTFLFRKVNRWKSATDVKMDRYGGLNPNQIDQMFEVLFGCFSYHTKSSFTVCLSHWTLNHHHIDKVIRKCAILVVILVLCMSACESVSVIPMEMATKIIDFLWFRH